MAPALLELVQDVVQGEVCGDTWQRADGQRADRDFVFWAYRDEAFHLDSEWYDASKNDES